LAAALALTLTVGCGGADLTAAAAPPLLPDLVVHGPHDVSLDVAPDGRRWLRFEVDVVNEGPGPVEMEPVPGQDCDGDGDPENDRQLVQLLYGDGDGDGRFDRSHDTVEERLAAGCSHFHAGHNHWHADAFASYRLTVPGGGRTVACNEKVTFCLHDVRLVGAGPGVPPAEHYQDCSSDASQGLSVGWSDDYYAQLDGQALDVTGVADGDYCLIAIANAAGLIAERDTRNNPAMVSVRLTGERVAVTPAGPDCGKSA
jgi:hypothetical protein